MCLLQVKLRVIVSKRSSLSSPISPSSTTTLVMQRRPTPLFHGTVQNSPGLLSELDEECAHTVTNWIVINMSIIRTNSTSQSSHNPRSRHQQINSSEAECFSIFLSCFSFTFFFYYPRKERKYRCLCKLHNLGCMYMGAELAMYGQAAVTYRFPSDYRSQAPSSGVSTWMGDHPGTPRAVGNTWCTWHMAKPRPQVGRVC